MRQQPVDDRNTNKIAMGCMKQAGNAMQSLQASAFREAAPLQGSQPAPLPRILPQLLSELGVSNVDEGRRPLADGLAPQLRCAILGHHPVHVASVQGGGMARWSMNK